MKKRIEKFISGNIDDMYDIHRQLCMIPAPSGFERERAAFIKEWLFAAGCKDAYIDSAENVILPLFCDGNNDITVIAAHTDTVFPADIPLRYTDDGGKIHCPGCADDTAGCVVLMMLARFIVDNGLKPQGLMIVWNSGEEGLGNLKGTRELFRAYSGRIRYFITIDSTIDCICDKCVGSHRYEVEVLTRGGHSFGDFGNESAVRVLAEMIEKIYKINIPAKQGTKTTLNVGTITGGTSVNTIAQSAKMLCEYRSDDRECMKFMEREFRSIFKSCENDDVRIKVQRVGERPCSDIEEEKLDSLRNTVKSLYEASLCKVLKSCSASTDCNIPMSLGVPAVCVGVCNYDGMHTLEECLDKKSLITGLSIIIELALQLVHM